MTVSAEPSLKRASGRYGDASDLLRTLVLSDDYPEFLTIPVSSILRALGGR